MEKIQQKPKICGISRQIDQLQIVTAPTLSPKREVPMAVFMGQLPTDLTKRMARSSGTPNSSL